MRPSMGQLLLLLAVAGCAQLARASVQLDGAISQRELLAMDAFTHDFGFSTPATCYRNSWGSPHRLYFVKSTDDGANTRFEFMVTTQGCQYKNSPCCNATLDHMVIKTGPAVTISSVLYDGEPATFSKGADGITLRNLAVKTNPSGQEYSLVIVAPKTSASTLQQLCPIAMFPDNCDFTSFNADESCCPSTVALDAQYRFTETEGNDVNDHCCVDDMNASPFIVRFAGVESRGADTAFRFQLSRKAVTSYIDLDGNAANRSCSNMALDDFGIAIYKDLDVKYVAFNGSVALWKIVRTGANPDAIWVNIAPKLAGSAITRQQPLDVLIVVAGAVTDLCPASKYMRAKNTCEISLHGTDPTGWCCPHGLTRTAPPPDECCVDDLDHSPYRLTLDGSVVSADSTEYTFRVSTTEVECVTDSHARDTGACDKHSIQSSKLAIFDKVSVQSVTVNGAAASFSTEPATSYSKWLKIEHSDVYYADFQEGAPMTIKVVVAGTVRELCPAQAAFGTQKPVCEFSLHGLQSRTQCCPHGVSFSA